MTSKTRTILLAIALVLIGGGILFFTRGDESELEDIDIELDAKIDENIPLEETEESELSEYPEGAMVYDINAGTVSYTAQKRLLQSEDEEIVGTTADINGAGWINVEDGAIFVEVEGDLTTLVTDDAGRDSEVLKMFGDPSLKIVVDTTVSGDLVVGEPFETEITGDVTLNSVTKEVTFVAMGTIDEETLAAIGTAEVNMSDFGINPPSLAGIFSVDNAVVLGFDISGIRVN